MLAASGWADGYTNAVFRLLAALDVPRKGLVGPWSHKYPHLGQPGPAVGFLQELVRWWDRWLCDADNGVMDEPMLRIWMQDSVPPSTAYAERPGRWVGEASWPSPQVHPVAHPLGDHRILAPGDRPTGAPERLTVSSPLSVASSPASGAPTTPRRTCPTTSARRTAARWSSTARCSPSGWRSSARRSWSWSSPSTGRWRWSRCGSRTSHPTAGPPGSATACATSPTATGTSSPWRWSRASATGCGWCSKPWRRRSHPATGCGWRSRPRTGPWPGPRRNR